jgi:predicted MFS family arabinose efflux permease
MKSDFILLLILNCFAAIGYSLIAPLYPKMAKEKGIGENICGIAISIYAISNFCITPFCPKIIQIFGRKRLLYLALLIEVLFN